MVCAHLYTHAPHTHLYVHIRTYILNGKGFLPTSDQNAMVFFRTMRPEHSEHIGKVFSPFLAGIEESFIHCSCNSQLRSPTSLYTSCI